MLNNTRCSKRLPQNTVLLSTCRPGRPAGISTRSLFTISGALLLLLLVLAAPRGVVAQTSYVNFEGSQTSPLRLSPDGQRLFAVNTPDARLSVFDLAQPSAPALIAEIPVGLEPVSVNPRTSDEAWVVNQISDSISIVSVSRGIVTGTIYVKDEPADVVFAGSPQQPLAFVTVARSNEVRVFSVATHALVATIPIFGSNPRALAVSPDGSKVYAAFALSGNRTTLIRDSIAPAPPAPTNPDLPPAPAQGLIVDAADAAWAPSHIKFTMPDNDVVEIDVASLTIARYFSRVGTINLGMAVQPTTGDIFVANTEARNLVRFEPNLRGHVVDNRLTRISTTDGTVTPFDLNASIDYSVLPNATAKATALAQPTAVVFEPGGNYLYLAAYGSDRVARVSAQGDVLSRIEIGGAAGAAVDPRNKRGPRGLALKSNSARLYVMNRIANTISVIDTASDAVVGELAVGSFDPTPAVIRQGRGFLYDAKLSGNGTASCASCHIDSDMDLLAWDLGDPGGTMQQLISFDGFTPAHPMKGPLTTQTLRGLDGLAPFHWRGDRSNFVAFNPAFDSLLGGTQLSSADMTAFRDFINTVRFQPNPNQNLDRTLPISIAGGDPIAGRNTYFNEPYTNTSTRAVTCNNCHAANPGPGTHNGIFSASTLQQPQPFKVPHLRNVYQKLGFNNTPGAQSRDGFGLSHDGQHMDIFDFMSRPVFDRFANDAVRQLNLKAFVLCFDTGMAPAVGYTQTLTGANVTNSDVAGDWSLLQNQAAAGNIDLIAKGTIDGQPRGLLYRPSTKDYQTDRTGIGPFTQDQLRAKITAGDILSVTGVPVGSGRRMGIDRNSDNTLDGDMLVPPAAPKNLSPSAISTTQVRLKWTDTANNELGFTIERCDGSSKCTNFAQIATVNQNITTFTNTGLTRNTVYRYRVRAHNGAGVSAYTNIARATTPR